MMAKAIASFMLQDTLEAFLHALHCAYPEIKTDGVRFKQPGLFEGHLAGDIVRVIPRPRAPIVYLMTKPSMNDPNGYVRFGLTKFKNSLRWRFGDEDQELKLLVYLRNATKELEAMSKP